MGKKNKLKTPEGADAVPENAASAERSVKARGKRDNTAEDASTLGTNGHGENEIKIKKKQKAPALPSDDALPNEPKVSASEKVTIERKLKQKKKTRDDSELPGEDLSEQPQKRKKKRAIDEENPHAEGVPPKVTRNDEKLISAGTTIDQVVGIKLKHKKGKREKKREKHTTLVEEQKKKSKEKERHAIRQYLECWSTDREQWKFNKLRQIHIQDHILDEAEITSELLPIALEYLSGTKGASRDLLVKKAETVIREGDSAAAADGDESLQASSKYERARQLLQCLG